MSDSKDKMLPFSRFAARLGRGRRIRRGDTLLDTADPESAVRALPVDEFYYLIAERGLPEAQDLLVLGSPEQVQMILDMEIWDRDRITPAKMSTWLAAMVEAPFERIYEWVRGLDIELVAVMLRGRMTLYDLTMGEEPETDPEGTLFKTPDGFFMIDATGTADEQRVTHALLVSLYNADINFARRVLVSLQAELDSDLEESAFRWRAGRLADLGFVDYYEALEVYAILDPNSVKIGEAAGQRVRPLADEFAQRSQASDALRMPTALAESMSSPKSRFARAVSALTDDDQIADIHAALVALSNRVLSAERVTPSDHEAIGDVLIRMQATLDLALEYISRGKEEDECQAIVTIPLVRLFRAGVSLVAKVGKLAHALLSQNPFSQADSALGLWEMQDAEVLEALAARRPAFPRLLDDEPTSGLRPFSSMADIAKATARVENIAAQLALLLALGVRPEMLGPDNRDSLGIRDPKAVDTGVLARTVLVSRLLGHMQPGLVALTEIDVARFARLDFDVVKRAIQTIVATTPRGELPRAAAAVAASWAASLNPLESVLVTSSQD
jgi:hypothetical protein